MPNCHPYEYYEVHTRTGVWGTNVAPNKPAALFWAPLERLSMVMRSLPSGHITIPFISDFGPSDSYDAPPPTREDCSALLKHLRLRGSYGYFMVQMGETVDYEQYMVWAWHDMDWLLNTVATPVVLTLDTVKSTGVQWSGMQAGSNIVFMLSNLGNSNVTIALPAALGVPTVSATILTGQHHEVYYIWDASTVATNAIQLGRDGNLVALYANRDGAFAKDISVRSNGTGEVCIGTDLSGVYTSVFSGELTLNRAVTLHGTADGGTVFSGRITGTPGVLSIKGAGPVLLSNASNDFQGAVVVADIGATLQIGSTGALGQATAITIATGATLDVSALTNGLLLASGQTLDGQGTVIGSLTVGSGANFQPGNPLGTLAITSNLVMLAGAALQYALGTNSTLTSVTGNLTLAGTLYLSDAGGFGPGSYTLFTYAGVFTNNGLAVAAVPNLNYGYSLDATSDIGQVKLTVASITPSLMATPSQLDFGALCVGQTGTQSFSVVNTGVQALTGTAAVDEPFDVISGSPYTLDAGQTGTVWVSCNLATTGIVVGTAYFTSDNGATTNTVTAQGALPVAASFTLTPATGPYPLTDISHMVYALRFSRGS